MSNDHVNPIVRQAFNAIQDSVSPPLRAALDADRQYINALENRIRDLEYDLERTRRDVQDMCATIDSLKSRLEDAAPSDYEIDLIGMHGGQPESQYVMAPESVMIKATKKLRERYAREFAALLETEYWLQLSRDVSWS